MFNRRNRGKAVTLLELLLVMIVVATLVAGFIITFQSLARRSHIRAAETMLRTILAAASDYHAQYGYYPDNLNVLYPRYMVDPNAAGTPARGWNYTIDTGGADFKAGANGTIGLTNGIIIDIDEEGNITQTP